jgi:hypothetical protein
MTAEILTKMVIAPPLSCSANSRLCDKFVFYAAIAEWFDHFSRKKPVMLVLKETKKEKSFSSIIP